MFSDGVEPTNNHSEQQIGHCVINRRTPQGTRGELGQRYHKRMWTAIAKFTEQEHNFFDFLYDSISAKLNNQSTLSLLLPHFAKSAIKIRNVTH